MKINLTEGQLNRLLMYEAEEEHSNALKKTGFWGKAGAGCLIMANDTKKFLFPLRSKDVLQPHTWGTWGGAIDEGEDPKQAVQREVSEEAGYNGPASVVPLFVFHDSKSNFKYYNYLVIVDHEFSPNLNWETDDAIWTSFNNLPSPLHFGVTNILNDGQSMQTIKKYARLNEEKNKIRKQKRMLTEAVGLQNKTLVSVDIQPEYENYIQNEFNLYDWAKFMNKSARNNNIVFLYNGEWTLGMISENEYRNWLYELGIKEDVLDRATFYDKGYAFFRNCMDHGVDEENVVDLVKFMMAHDINDTRAIDTEMWDEYMKETNRGVQDVRDLMESSEDMLTIPDLMEALQPLNNIVLFGGGINECLKEVEIALLALNKPYNTLSQYTY